MQLLLQTIAPFLPHVQIALALMLIAGILLQQRGSSLGGAFGGDNYSSGFHKRRGGELFLFRITILLAVLFVLSVLVSLVVA